MSNFEYKRIKRPNRKKYRALSRRNMLRQMIFAGVLVTFPGAFVALAQQKISKQAPVIPFKPSEKGTGIIGPYGEVNVFDIGGKALPLLVSAVDGSALMDFTGRSTFVRYGRGITAITLNADGVKFGIAKVEPWSKDVVSKLVAALVQDPRKARGAMLLRSTLHTSYPIAALKSKLPTEKKVGAVISRGAAAIAAATICTTTQVTETVIRTVTSLVDVWKTAETRYQECYDSTIAQEPCKSAGFGLLTGVCAAGFCSLQGFVDIVVGVIEVVTTVAEEVTREVVSCVSPAKGVWPNPWSPPFGGIKASVPQPVAKFSPGDIEKGVKLLKDITGFLGVYGSCLLKGKWGLAQLDTGIDLGGGNIVIPYGIKVCLDSACATKLLLENIFTPGLAAWGSALSVLAALSPQFGALVAPVITISPAIVAAVAAAPPVVVAVAAIILAFIMMTLVWGTVISAQLSFHNSFTDNFSDGSVCIEHPTFAIALVELLTVGQSQARLIPPIVTG
jgi:hypothetical protein